MHMHNSLQSLAGELSGNGGDLGRIRPLAVQKQAAALRAGYYGQRTGDVFEEHQAVLGRVMAKIGTIQDKAGIKRLLVEHGDARRLACQPRRPSGKCWPEG